MKTPSDEADTRVEAPRELLDVAPTIAAEHDAEYDGFRGESLRNDTTRVPISLGQPPEHPPACAVRTDDWVLVTGDDVTELYAAGDAGQTDDVSDENSDIVQELEQQIPSNVLNRTVEPPRQPRDEVDEEQLRALGYMELREEEE